MTWGPALPSYRATSTLEGFTSRWMTPFWWACWIAWQTGTKSSSRSRGVSLWSSREFGIVTALTRALLVGVLDRLAHWDEEFQPLARGQLVVVAEFGNRDALDQLHDEVGAAFV